MHSYADTWSHEGFTGNRSRKNNVLKKVFINENDKWTRDISLKRILCRMLPSIGHSKVYALPDISNINWRYTKNGDKIIRNNTELFLEASENIYQIFCNINNTIPKWQKIKNNVREYLYTGNLSLFPNIKFNYNKLSWREISLHGNNHNWENFSKNDYLKLSFSAKDDYRWFYFHEEASKQRYLVIKHLNRYGK